MADNNNALARPALPNGTMVITKAYVVDLSGVAWWIDPEKKTLQRVDDDTKKK